MPKRLNIEDYIGKKYERLTVIKEVNFHVNLKTGEKRAKVLCICECGAEKEIILNNLKRKSIKSCGCLNKELNCKKAKTHGLTNTSEYKIYTNIKARCYNPKNKAYKNYGERGIIMSNEWLDSFEQFYEDMGERPSTKHSIERNRVNEDYSKENCRWATIHEQAANKRNSNKTVGVYLCKVSKKWKACLKINNKVVLNKSFKTEEEAIAARKAAEIEFNIYN
jgi:hypothetical protein